MKTYGIDVSHHQPSIDWPTVAKELYKANGSRKQGFCMVRAGYSKRTGKGGLVVDSSFYSHVQGCQENGIPFGVYFYCYDESPAAARVTAQAVVELLKPYKPEYPVYYDVEYEKYNTSCGAAANNELIKAAMEVLEGAGYYAGVYCSRDFFQRYTDLAGLKAYDKWEAAYVKTDSADVDNGIWQYSAKNALGLTGFGTSLDCDIAYKNYPYIIRKAGLNGWQKGEGL